ncbi:unnamed protein product [Closterium sp. NIES-53]
MSMKSSSIVIKATNGEATNGVVAMVGMTMSIPMRSRRGDEGEVVFEGSKELPLQRFPWLILDKTTDGFPFVHCSACIEHGKDGARNGCNGKGGRDLQIGSFGWHKASVQHDNAMKKQMGLMKKIEEQKRIDDFAKGDPEGTQISRLMRSIVFVCKTDTPIQMYPRLVQFLAEEEFADIPRQSDGVYITQYGFAETVKALTMFLHCEQMQHLHASPYFGISCDESTNRARGKHMIVFVTILKNHVVVTEFLSLLTINQSDASSLLAVLLQQLESIGIDWQKIVGISTDGPSIMVGSQTGLVMRLRVQIPILVGCHCIAHW